MSYFIYVIFDVSSMRPLQVFFDESECIEEVAKYGYYYSSLTVDWRAINFTHLIEIKGDLHYE